MRRGGSFKSLGTLFSVALGVGMNMQAVRRMFRASQASTRRTRGLPSHQGARECARRRRQNAAGMLTFHNYGNRP